MARMLTGLSRHLLWGGAHDIWLIGKVRVAGKRTKLGIRPLERTQVVEVPTSYTNRAVLKL